MRLPTATAVSMTTAVTTKVARNLPRSPNFQDLASGEFKMWRGHGARGLARRRAHVHFSLLHVGRPLVVHADGGGYLPSIRNPNSPRELGSTRKCAKTSGMCSSVTPT